MPSFFISDVHLRLDRPERGRRLARFLEGVAPGDDLTIVGDLCDFWFAARQRLGDITKCEGLLALIRRRDAGGRTTVLLGNHDTWLGSFYRETFDAEVVDEPLDVVSHGLRIRMVHGHLLGARSAWKGAMESRAFLHGFGLLPSLVADRLALKLKRSNARLLEKTDARHRVIYRQYADSVAGEIDLLVVGHIHVQWDDPGPSPRLVVLGGWHSATNYLRVNGSGAHLVNIPSHEGQRGAGMDSA
ncbi:metallophosphoesterase [Isosphaeraceae bacterium EP7]